MWIFIRKFDHPSIQFFAFYLGRGSSGSRLSRDALSPATSSIGIWWHIEAYYLSRVSWVYPEASSQSGIPGTPHQGGAQDQIP